MVGDIGCVGDFSQTPKFGI